MENEEKKILESWKNGIEIVPTKEQLQKTPNLLYYDYIVSASLENDPSIIELLKGALLKQKYCDMVIDKKLEITEELIKKNPSLTKFTNIMEAAIEKTPQLIKYIHCDISDTIISKTSQYYKLTKQDLIKNPYLIDNEKILKNNPQLYIFFQYPIKIIELQDILKTDPLKIRENEFFKNKQDYINKIIYLTNKLIPNDKNNQKYYYEKLLKIIDRIAIMRYKNSKKQFKYTDIVEMNHEIIRVLSEVEKTNNILILYNLEEELYIFANKKISKEKLQEKLQNFYQKYREKHSLNIEYTKDLCNEILNHHRDKYIKDETEKMIQQIKETLFISEKKQNQINKSIKIRKISELIKNNELFVLGTTQQEIVEHIEKIEQDIKTNKKLKKNNYILTNKQFDELKRVFLEYGTLNNPQTLKVLNTQDKKIIKYITNKYEKIKLNYVEKIELENINIEDDIKEKLSLNSNNFNINDKEKNYFTIALIIYNITEKEIDRILSNEIYIDEIKGLIPFVNILPELTVSTLKNIFTEYGKIKKEISNYKNVSNDYIYNNLDQIITYSQGLDKIDDNIIIALGKEIVNQVGESFCADYLNIYIKMLKKTYSFIPPIEMTYNDLELKSGDYFNAERLLIGKCAQGSCIDINNPAGEKTYKGCLLKPESDVILIRKNNQLIDRILVFRKGNVIQMVTQNKHEYPLEMYERIAQIMEKEAQYDNIDYIVVNHNSIQEKETNTLTDGRFETFFPHSDTTDKVVVLYSNSNKIQFLKQPQYKYLKVRKSINYNPTTKEINQLLALNKYMNYDHDEYNNEYTTYICGEDWLLINNNGEMKEILLNNEDSVAKHEIEEAKEKIINRAKKH